MKTIELSDREAKVFLDWLMHEEVRYSNEHQADTITPRYHVETDVILTVIGQLEDQSSW